MSLSTELIACLLLTLYLAPCAWQDWRSRTISNWLTIPGFLLAWPLAVYLGHLPIAFAIFVGCYVAWKLGGMGAADGKLATLVTAVTPGAIWLSGGLLVLGFVALRILGGHGRSVPAAVYLFAGLALITATQVMGITSG